MTSERGRGVPLRSVELDGSPERVAVLIDALAAALDGGPPVLPLAAGAEPAAQTAPEGTAVVIATSGSTGEPKLVALSAASLRASALATELRLGGPARWLLALPAEHVAGVQVIVRALLAGTPPHVLDMRDGFRPAGFAEATAALGPAPRYTSLVPTQLRRILDAAAEPVQALRGYAAVLVGGAALDDETRERAIAEGVRVVTTYGMSETAGGCVYDGVPLDGVTVDLDADGRILLGGPTLASGYVGPADETAVAFAGGRFRTGDLGRWSEGRLEVLGRADDMIVTGGEKVAPAAVERVLAGQPGVRAASVTGIPDDEWGQVVVAVVVLEAAAAWQGGGQAQRPADPARGPGHAGAAHEPGQTDAAHGHADAAQEHADAAQERSEVRRPADADASGWADPLRAAVRAELGRAAVPRRIVVVAEIPLRGIGKPDRAAVARLVVGQAPEAGCP